ncbi:alpha/beta hydrolase [Flaviflexus huanghaiensis]|uniref:alpha/beta hydrolase n=1 Tax=Flaviflexus huanghaiensis TaxID=1111473 RepID=UPI0015FD4948|nr:alpha/beta-hydrolase family protein [Flaviflexus huanghaiensis]
MTDQKTAPAYHGNGLDRSTMNTQPWWMPDLVGSLVGFIFAVLSVTPTLLPRPAVLQGILGALAFAAGYLIGVAAWSAIRRLLWKDGAVPPFRRVWWYVYGLAWIAAIVALSTATITWQNDVRALVSMPPVDEVNIIGFLTAFLPLTVILLLIGKGVRAMYGRFRRRRSWIVASSITAGIVIAAVAIFVAVVMVGIDRYFYSRNQTYETTTEPGSEHRSAGPESAMEWEDLGRHGAAFVGGGPTREDIETITGSEAMTPIRVYAGLESAETVQERAELVVDELERTGAFDRSVLVVATPTGSGWLEPQTIDSIEYLHGGDTAIASMQYAYTPSWVSFIFDEDAPVASATALTDAVHARWSELPEDDRPQLVVYGLSLGAHGGQAAFDDVADLRSRTDGAMFAGSPPSAELWSTLQSQRDEGSPAWQPVLGGGREVRWISKTGDEEKLTGPWIAPRVLYLQHPSDPVVWLSPKVLWSSPEWLEPDQRSDDISASMRWMPVVTGLQVFIDMLGAESVPAFYGHNYGNVALTGWQQITADSGLDEEALSRIRAEIETYAPIPPFEQ